MRHRTKHNISGSKTHWDVQKAELPSKQSTQPACCNTNKNRYVKGAKFNTFTICVISLLLLCIIGVMYWYQLHTMTSVFWRSEFNKQNSKDETKNSIDNKGDDITVIKNKSNETEIKVKLPFIPLRDRAEVHLSQNTMVNFTSMESHHFDELDVIAFVLPPVIQNKISEIKLESFLRLGTRVAGTNREGHLQFLLRDALKELYTSNSALEPSETVPSHEEGVSTLQMQSAWWSLEWDNFTEDGPNSFSESQSGNNSSFSNPISFTNVIFTFQGGRAYQEQLSEQKINNETSTNTEQESVNKHSPKRNHIVFAAHWDSKWQPIGLLGACDSAVPLLMLTRLMQNIATLSEISTQLHSIAEETQSNVPFDEYYLYSVNNSTNGNDSRLTQTLRKILSPIQYHYLVEYYLGISSSKVAVNQSDDIKQNKSKFAFRNAEKEFIDWIKWIDASPPITVILFDGEEAFEEWQGKDNTYGSRHLATRWRREKWQTTNTTRPTSNTNNNKTSDTKNNSKTSKYDSIELFVLLDLLGTRGAELHNFFPSFSGAFYKQLASIERHGRQRALQQSIVMAKQFVRDSKQHPHKDSNHSEIIRNITDSVHYNLVQEALRHISSSHKKIPEIWQRYGAPHEMFTLFDFKHSEIKRFAQERAKRKSQKEEELKRLTFEHTYDIMQTIKVPLNTSTKWEMLQELNRNVFFSPQEAVLHRWGSNDAHFTGIEDDHKHWLATKRVLHLIAAPFPEEWHTLADNGSNIDHGTVVDVNKILWQFVLQLGKHAK